MKRLLSVGIAMLLAFASAAIHASFHLYSIEQVYSNADGTVQFVVLQNLAGANGENQWAGHAIVSRGPGPEKAFTFPTNLPSFQTSGHRVLVATQGFAALGLVTPDYVVPNGFLQIPNGTVDFAGVDALNYTGLPNDGVRAVDFTGAAVQNKATNFAGASATVVPANAPPAAALNFEGLWYNAPAESEAGWGINFAHQGDVIFATWFTYDAAGRAWWLTMTANKTATNTYAGSLYQTRGPAFSAVPFRPAEVTVTAVGTGTLTFADAGSGSFAYTVNGIAQTKNIVRQVFGPLPTCTFGAQANLAAATNFQDLWYAAPAESEAGWGVNFTHQGDIIFATWFTYDADGAPLWLSATLNRTAAGVYSGRLNRTAGPAFSAVPFVPASVTLSDVGTLTVTFAHGNSASFAYTVNLGGANGPVTQTKSIVRQVFRSPGTVCQ